MSKERLTERNETNTAYFFPLCFKKCDGMGASSKCDRCEVMSNVCEKLAEYEDLEEQGLLLKLPFVDNDTEHRECVYTKATCHHKEYKCSECPLTELFCDEFYKAVERCYEEAYASGCLAGIELGKSEAEEKLRELEGK